MSHAFLWENGRMRDLGVLSEGPGLISGVDGINEHGQIVGSRDTPTKDQHDFAVAQHAFLWQKGTFRDLATLGGASSYARAINDRGQIVGESDTKAKGGDGKPISHAFLWEKGTMRDLGTLGGSRSAALGVNDRGQIVGWSDTRAGERHAVLWTYKP